MNKTAKNSMIYLCGTVIMALLGFVSTMLLTRVLSQKVYAMYGLLATLVTAVDMFIAFGYDQVYMRFFYVHDCSACGFFWNCVKVPLVLFLLFAAVFLEPGQNLIILVFAEKLTLVAVSAVLGRIFFSSTHRFGQLTARMSECAGNYVISNIISKSGFLGIVLTLSVIIGDVSFEWVCISLTVMAMLATVINLAVFRKITNLRNPNGKHIAGREMVRYGFPYMINNVLVLLIPILEKIMIRNLSGWETLSVFTAASIFQTVVSVVVNTINNIWNPLVFKHCEKEEVFKPILHTFGMVGTIILITGTAGCILLRRWLVLILDDKYHVVYIIAPVIMLAACFNILSAIYSVGINIKKKTGHFIVAPIVQIILSIYLCYLLIPSMGLTGVAISVLISVGCARFYHILVGLHYYNTGMRETKVFVLCLLCTVAAVASLFFTAVYHDIVISVLLLVLTGVILNKDFVSALKHMMLLFGMNTDR